MSNGAMFHPPSAGARPAATRSWTASSKPAPQVQINNVNAQGSDIPINIGTTPEPDIYITHSDPSPPLPLYEPLEFRFSGPSNPDRLVGMLIALVIAGGPLMMDYARDWPVREYHSTDYIQATYHYIIAALSFVFALLAADRKYAISTQYGPHVRAGMDGIGNWVTPAMVATVEGGESLVWGAEDMVFGEGRHVLGVAVAAGLVFLVSMRKPMKPGTVGGTQYAAASVQFVYLIGAGVVGLLFWNA